MGARLMDDSDSRVRLAAFRFLEEQLRLAADESVLTRKVLEERYARFRRRVG
jgi:hypothetical protein